MRKAMEIARMFIDALLPEPRVQTVRYVSAHGAFVCERRV